MSRVLSDEDFTRVSQWDAYNCFNVVFQLQAPSSPSRAFFHFSLAGDAVRLMKLNVFWFCWEVYFVGASSFQFQSMSLKPKNQSGVKCSIAHSNGKGKS